MARKRFPWHLVAIRVALDVAIIITLLLAIYNQHQTANDEHSRNVDLAITRRADYSNCQRSNSARQVVINVLTAAKDAALAPTGQIASPQQRAAVTTFYTQQLAKITLFNCSSYKH